MVTIDVRRFCNGANLSTKNSEILASEIARYYYNCDKPKINLSLEIEGWDIVENGLEDAVKNIADTIGIPYHMITFYSCDRLGKSKYFKVVQNTHLYSFFCNNLNNSSTISIPEKNNYGMFNGRANCEKLYALYKHFNWKNSSLGIASMHEDINDCLESESEYAQFAIEYNEQFNMLKQMIPCSDIGPILTQEQLYKVNSGNEWADIYKKIAIEIICETNYTSGTFFITEKTYRAIHYGRLFVIAGSPDFEKNLKNLGFDVYDDIIDKSYDKESGYVRIDKIFNSVDNFLKNPIDYKTILDRLEKNKKVLREMYE